MHELSCQNPDSLGVVNTILQPNGPFTNCFRRKHLIASEPEVRSAALSRSRAVLGCNTRLSLWQRVNNTVPHCIHFIHEAPTVWFSGAAAAHLCAVACAMVVFAAGRLSVAEYEYRRDTTTHEHLKELTETLKQLGKTPPSAQHVQDAPEPVPHHNKVLVTSCAFVLILCLSATLVAVFPKVCQAQGDCPNKCPHTSLKTHLCCTAG